MQIPDHPSSAKSKVAFCSHFRRYFTILDGKMPCSSFFCQVDFLSFKRAIFNEESLSQTAGFHHLEPLSDGWPDIKFSPTHGLRRILFALGHGKWNQNRASSSKPDHQRPVGMGGFWHGHLAISDNRSLQVRFHDDIDGSSLAHAIYASTGPLLFPLIQGFPHTHMAGQVAYRRDHKRAPAKVLVLHCSLAQGACLSTVKVCLGQLVTTIKTFFLGRLQPLLWWYFLWHIYVLGL